MEIRFSKIIPAPIPERDIAESEIWGRDIFLGSGEKVLVYADSGKGKTTFINIIFGTRKDFRGDAFLDDKNINELSLDDYSLIHKSKLSIVPQGLLLFPELTVMDNILIKNRIQNRLSSTRIAEMLNILGMTGFENRKAGLLSFGQRQRIAIIRSLCQSFEYILLDEAFSHLDTTNTQIAWDLIKSEAEKQDAGIIITSLDKNFDSSLKKLRV